MDKITIELYTANSVAVFGNTIAIKEHFKRIGGTYNANLKGSDGETKRKGWIFPKSKLQDVRELLVEYSNNTLDTSYVHQSKQPSVQQMLQPSQQTLQPSRQKPEPVDNSDEFVFTHKMYLSLVSRIERLEAELVIAKKALAGTITNSSTVQPVQKQTKKNVVEYEEEEEEEEERPSPVKVVQEAEIQEIEEIQPKRLLRNKKQKEPEINL